MQFVDTNVFLRFLTKDNLKKSERSYKLFQKAERGDVSLSTTESVVAEIVFILQSKKIFNISREEIVKSLMPVIKIKGLKVPHKNIIITALLFYSKYNIDFEDAILASFTLNSKTKELFSYDRDFDKIEGIKRLEP